MEHISSVHVKPCNIAQSERHNRRDMDYINSLDPAIRYVRTDLMHLNESYVAPGMEGISLQELYDAIKAMVKEKTGRAMQEKDVEYMGKNGKTKVRQGCSPIRESVVNIKSDTMMADLLRYSERVHERWGIKAIQIHMHKDEGHYENIEDPASWKPNLHAHIIWDWMNHTTGKSYKLKAKDMSEMQDMAAETLAMVRGKRKEETGADHLERNDYILQKQREEMKRLQEEAERAQAKKKAAEAQAAAAEAEKAAVEQQTAAANAEKAAAEQKAKEASEKLAEIEARMKPLEDERKQLVDSIAEMHKEKNKLATSIRSTTNKKLKLEAEVLSKDIQSKSLDSKVKSKNAKIEQIDAALQSKNQRMSELDAGIEEKEKKVGELDEQLSNLMLAQQKIQISDDWRENIFRALTALLYAGDDNMKACIKAIQDYACSGRGGRGKQYRSFFADEEAFCIKAFMEYFYKLTHVAAVQTGSLLVWMANELNPISKFSDWEKKNVAREVNDVAIGRYDGRIRRVNGRGGGRGW